MVLQSTDQEVVFGKKGEPDRVIANTRTQSEKSELPDAEKDEIVEKITD